MSITIADVYRSTHVERWHIVKTKRSQTIAEHSYIVAMLASAMGIAMRWEDRNNEIVMYALTHDLAEVLTGDIPSPMKKTMGAPFAAIEEEIMGDYNLWAAEGEIKDLVKLADIAEAARFLQENKDSSHADSVYEMVIGQLGAQRGKMVYNHPNLNWDPAFDVVHNFLYGEEYTIDTYFNEKY